MLTVFGSLLHWLAGQIWSIENVYLIQVHRESNVDVLGYRNDEPSLETSVKGINLLRNYIWASIFHTEKSEKDIY
jgi:hypothetical protein